MLVILGITLMTIFGYLFSVALIGKMRAIERIGVSFLLGVGVFTFLMFCYSTLGVKITLISTLAALILFNFLGYLLVRILHRKIYLKVGVRDVINKMSRLEKIFVGVISTLGIASLVFTVYYPVNIWDALALYDFRAKVIFDTGYFTQIAGNFYYFVQYPLFTSLSHTFVYIFGVKNPQFIYSFLYLSFLFAFYGALMDFVPRKIALVSTALLASTPVVFEHSTFAYTNLPYAIFISLGTIYLYIWIAKGRKIGYLILSALMMGLSTWTRASEPFWAVGFFAVIVYSIYRFVKYRDSILSPIWYFLTFFPIKEIWAKIYFELLNGPSSTVSLLSAEIASHKNALFNVALNFEKLTEVFIFIWQFVVVTWYPISILFVLSLALNLKNIIRKSSTMFLVFILLHFALLIYGTYIFSSNAYWNSIPDSARRLAMFFLPLMLFYIGLSIGEISSKISK